MSQLTPLIGLSAMTVKVLLETHKNKGIFQDQTNRGLINHLTKQQFLQPAGLAYTTTTEGEAWLRHAGIID